MATHIIHPTHFLEPDALDNFLERGWRPTGQSIYTSDYLRTDDDELHGCLQIRLPLRDFTFKKRHRKLLRRNAQRFRVVYEEVAGMPDEELLNVNRLYMRRHPDKTREDLEYNVINETGQRILNTGVIRVYDRHRLVAFSYFDRGQKVVYTKAGIYDPEYAAYSLGTYTMLLEVELALSLEFDYYYPGYFSPSYPAFDYKLQLGPMQYREITSAEWLPLDGSVPADPLVTNTAQLDLARTMLVAAGVRVQLREYPSFTGRFRPSKQGENLMLDAPLLLLIGRPLPLDYYLILTYDVETANFRYDVVRNANLYDMRVRVMSELGTPRFTTPVVVHNRIVETPDLALAVRCITEHLRGHR